MQERVREELRAAGLATDKGGTPARALEFAGMHTLAGVVSEFMTAAFDVTHRHQ